MILGLFGLWQIKLNVFAEQSGSSPESGADSRIKAVYDSLVSLSHGSESAGGWGNWGTWWNRIRSAGEWVPSGDAAVGDVKSDKTFYKDSRTQQTGTLSLTGDATTADVGSGKTFYSDSFTQQAGTADLYYFDEQSLVEWDDYKTGDSTAEEAVWTNTAGTATAGVWKDTRTGLYWSNSRGQFDNIFPDTTHTACPFFALSDRGAYDGLDADCGNSINACGILSLDADGDAVAETDWYLPSQKELQQAYIDGAYNQNSTWTTTSNFWSSTELSDNPAYAWYVLLHYGYTNVNTKVTATYDVRCVRRD